jgi:acyl-CoA reductase-like NAD-dependent aldehyde dehydrogenase
MAFRVPMLIGGQWVFGTEERDIIDPYRGGIVSRAPESNREHLNAVLEAAVSAKVVAATMPAFERAALLRNCAVLVGQRYVEIAEIMCRETGKPLTECESETKRCADTIALSAEEAVRITGAHVPLEASAAGTGKIAFLLRFPVGVVGAITPFNAPVNLAMHKIAPALAAGNAIVLKAPLQCPQTLFKVSEIFHDAGVPPGMVNFLYGDTVGPLLVADERVDFVTFTGSTRVGAAIRRAAGLKRVALELGGIGPTIVHLDAEIDEAAAACGRHAMRIAGQSCVSVQNVFVHSSIADAFTDKLVGAVRKMKLGDPLERDTDLGPVIDEASACRIERTICDAVTQGAKVLLGGKRRGQMVDPTVLTNVTLQMDVACKEIFGPVCSIHPYDDIEPVFRHISNHELGLQTGVYTASFKLAIRAAKSIRSGGVILNGTSTFRTDQLAYGGVKHSGIGREGPFHAIRDMTEERMIVFNV